MAHTPGPWRAVPHGGSSTVVAPVLPRRNDTRIPAYGYNEQKGHCVAYPFISDEGSIRLDFVCFNHDDARLIAAAPALLAIAEQILERGYVSKHIKEERDDHIALVAAITAAKGLQHD